MRVDGRDAVPELFAGRVTTIRVGGCGLRAAWKRRNSRYASYKVSSGISRRGRNRSCSGRGRLAEARCEERRRPELTEDEPFDLFGLRQE